MVRYETTSTKTLIPDSWHVQYKMYLCGNESEFTNTPISGMLMTLSWIRPKFQDNILESEINYKLRLFKALLYTGFPFPIYYGILALKSGYLINVALNCFICLILILGLVTSYQKAPPKKRIRQILLFSYAYLAILAILHISFIISHRLEHASWFVIFPLLTFIALGNRHGIVAVAVYIFAIIAALWLVDTAPGSQI